MHQLQQCIPTPGIHGLGLYFGICLPARHSFPVVRNGGSAHCDLLLKQQRQQSAKIYPYKHLPVERHKLRV
jgi:hypothetical protein